MTILQVISKHRSFQIHQEILVCNIERLKQTGYLHNISATIFSTIANICVIKPENYYSKLLLWGWLHT
jgi:hypothetical protein